MSARGLAGGAGAAAVVVVAAVLLLGAGGGGGGTVVQAEFSNARGLLVDNEVRIQGAPAGTVERIELTPRNTALVTIRLHDGLPRPRRDAVAAIRPVDLLGDIYLSLSPGHDREPLRGPIPLSQTSNEPRLSDMLAAFPSRSRRGLQAMLVSLGIALDRRGEDVNRAVVALRPALEATDGVMRELDSQRASLRSLIADGERMTRQLASRGRALGGSIEGLAGTLRAVAARAPQLDRGLQTLPDTLGRLRGTSTRLASTARAALPLGVALERAAPPLALASRRLAGFLDAAHGAVVDARPLVRSLGDVLRSGRPTLGRLATGLTALGGAAPDLDALMKALGPAAAPIAEGFFVNFADQGAEPGNQPFDPFADPARNYWRGAAVFTCEAFGVRIAPNCLQQYLYEPASRRRAARGPTVPAAGGAANVTGPATAPAAPAAPPAPPVAASAPAPSAAGAAARRMLDYLLGP